MSERPCAPRRAGLWQRCVTHRHVRLEEHHACPSYAKSDGTIEPTLPDSLTGLCFTPRSIAAANDDQRRHWQQFAMLLHIAAASETA